jgi:signal transduction histidine kinase
MRPVSAAKRVRLESFIDSVTGPIDGDAVRLRQAIHSLLAHAFAHTPAGGHIVVECRTRETFVELVIRDNGVGIAAETLAHLFDPLWQVQRVRAEPGNAAGLGIAVAHRVIELHGGRIFAESQGANRGSLIAVYLPFASGRAALQSRRRGKI